jgi:hypothetical protein
LRDDATCPSSVKECDDYAEELLFCIALHPEDPLGPKLPNMCRDWAERAGTPEGRASVAATCRALREELGRGCR